MFRIFGQGKWNDAVSRAFVSKHGLDIIELARKSVGIALASAICRKVANDAFFFANAELAGEQIARILEQANGISVNDIIQRNQLELAMNDKWDLDRKGFTDVPYRDPSVTFD